MSTRNRGRMWSAFGAATLAAALLVSGCGSGGSSDTSSQPTTGSTPTTGGEAPAAAKKVGMALAGPRNDGSFNQANYEGLLAAEKELGVKGIVVDQVQSGQPRVEALKNLALSNDLVIGVGAEFAPAGLAVAPQFPDVEFVIINGQISDKAPNLHAYFVREGVPAYIAGVAAAQITKTKTVAFIGGELIPPIVQSDDSFKAAIEATDPSIKYMSLSTGNGDDVALAKQATATAISRGADIIFFMLNNAIPGAEQAIEESGKDVQTFFTIVPRCDSGKNVVGTATLNSAQFQVQIVKAFLDGALPTEVKAYGVEEPEIQTFELCPEWKTPDLTSLVEDLTKKMNAGEIEMPKGA